MNTLILIMLFSILFDLLSLAVSYEEITYNILCFLSRLIFGYFMANLKKNRCLKHLSDDVNFFFRVTTITIMYRSKYVPNNKPPEERNFFSYLDDLKYEEALNNTDKYFKEVKVVNFDIINHICREDPLEKSIHEHLLVKGEDFKKYQKKMTRKKLSAALSNVVLDHFVNK